MRGPFYNDSTGVTGEAHEVDFSRAKTENYETTVDADGSRHTRLLTKEASV